MNFFDILRNILAKGDDELYQHPDFDKVFNSYMLIRYLSMRDSLMPFALIIQDMQKAGINDLQIYKFAYNHIPKTNPFIKYIKAKKAKNETI